jgi:hypothetical protein
MSSDKYADISNYREKLFPDCTAGSLVAGSQERTDPKKCWDMREALEVVTKDNIKGRDKNPIPEQVHFKDKPERHQEYPFRFNTTGTESARSVAGLFYAKAYTEIISSSTDVVLKELPKEAQIVISLHLMRFMTTPTKDGFYFIFEYK